MLQSKEKTLEIVSNALKKGLNPNYSPQLPPIRMDVNPTRIYKQ
jgi:hypothetical protein